jgi:chemotaxis protein methyltransferase CheR
VRLLVENSWEWFISKFEDLSRIDLTAYKRPQMERRINSFMRSAGASDYKSFLELIKNDAPIYKRFLEHITINVSEFFRNANHWSVLQNQILPLLLADRKSLRVWSAGCSTGEEPYSLAMIFKEKRIPLTDKILATDLDQDVLNRAMQGIYSSKAVQGIPPAYLNRYFINQGDKYQVSEELRSMITFKRHDLLREPFGHGFDLILCRNVVIYFTEETKNRLYQRFTDSLTNGGVLFIGSTEQIFLARELGLKTIATFFYQKGN